MTEPPPRLRPESSSKEAGVSDPAGDNHRSPEEAAREAARAEVSDVLLNLEHTITRAKKALATARKNGSDSNAELALTDAIADLERIHKRLMHDTYYAADSLRLI
jgi:hypothetical protein